MYTGRVVTLRSFAFVVALQLAATPAIGVVCDLSCDRPETAASECHDQNDVQHGAAMRSAGHSCDHDEQGIRPALLTGPTGGRTVSTAPPAIVAHAFMRVGSIGAVGMHGPPGLRPRSTSSSLTVLRI